MQEISAGLDLTRGNNFKNLVKLSLPIMASNFMQTFYNLVDTFWLGKTGEQAREAVSIAGIAFPIIFFFASFGIGLVIAGTALVARYKGAGMPQKIKELVGQFGIVFVLTSGIFVLVGLLFMDSILHLLQTPPEVFHIGRQYMNITIISVFFMFVFFAYQSFAHGLGDTVTPMKIQIISLSLNVILDPFMIFGWWIFPEFGILGAAYATFLCRFLMSLLAIVMFLRKTPEFIPTKKLLKPNFKVMWSILKIGIPASISQSTISIGFLVLQGFVNSYGTVVISVNAIGNRMISIFMMPAMGLSKGLATIVGQNLGANNISRIKQSVVHTFFLVLLIMGSGGIIMFLFGGNITKLFIDDPEVITVGARMFRITSVASNFFGILFIFIGVFNGSGQTVPAMMFNIARLWVFRVPLVYLLSGKLLEYASSDFLRNSLSTLAAPLSNNSYDALWWSMLVSNIMASIIAFILYKTGKWKVAGVRA